MSRPNSTDTVFHAIAGSPMIRATLQGYLNKVFEFSTLCYKNYWKQLMPGERPSPEHIEETVLLRHFQDPSLVKMCGQLHPTQFKALLNSGDANIRELLTHIMLFSRSCCHMLWCVYGDFAKTKEKQKNCNAGPKKATQVQAAEAEAVAPFLALLNEEVLEMRMDHIKQRFNIKGSKIKGYSDNPSGRQYVKELSPYPTFCHAITQSTNMVDNMTLHLERLFPRNRSKKWLYEWILDLQDVRLKPDMVVPALSAREIEYIINVAPMMETKYGSEYFVSGAVKTVEQNGLKETVLERIPWEMGFMSSRVHPQNIYNKLAAELSRYIILGPSGTLEFMLNVAEIFDIDLRIMTLASITWMYVARDHSLFEMMIVANQYFEPPLFKFEPIEADQNIQNEDAKRRAQYKQALVDDHQQLIDLLVKIDPTAASAAKSESFIPNELGYLEFIHGSTATLTQIGGEVPCRFKASLPENKSFREIACTLLTTPEKRTRTHDAVLQNVDDSLKDMITITDTCQAACKQGATTSCTVDMLFRRQPLDNDTVTFFETTTEQTSITEHINKVLATNVGGWKWDDKPWGFAPSPSHLLASEEDISNSGLPDLPEEYKTFNPPFVSIQNIGKPLSQQVRDPEPKKQLTELLGTVSLQPTNSIGDNVFKRLSS